jgi:hypothetical protein
VLPNAPPPLRFGAIGCVALITLVAWGCGGAGPRPASPPPPNPAELLPADAPFVAVVRPEMEFPAAPIHVGVGSEARGGVLERMEVATTPARIPLVDVAFSPDRLRALGIDPARPAGVSHAFDPPETLAAYVTALAAARATLHGPVDDAAVAGPDPLTAWKQAHPAPPGWRWTRIVGAPAPEADHVAALGYAPDAVRVWRTGDAPADLAAMLGTTPDSAAALAGGWPDATVLLAISEHARPELLIAHIRGGWRVVDWFADREAGDGAWAAAAQHAARRRLGAGLPAPEAPGRLLHARFDERAWAAALELDRRLADLADGSLSSASPTGALANAPAAPPSRTADLFRGSELIFERPTTGQLVFRERRVYEPVARRLAACRGGVAPIVAEIAAPDETITTIAIPGVCHAALEAAPVPILEGGFAAGWTPLTGGATGGAIADRRLGASAVAWLVGRDGVDAALAAANERDPADGVQSLQVGDRHALIVRAADPEAASALGRRWGGDALPQDALLEVVWRRELSAASEHGRASLEFEADAMVLEIETRTAPVGTELPTP